MNVFKRAWNALKKASDSISNDNYSRMSDNISLWRQALDSAEDVDEPDRVYLYQTYKNAIDDTQIWAVMETRINRITLKKYFLENDDGTKNEEETEKLKTYWTTQFIKYKMESIFWGYKLVQINDIEDSNIKSIEKINEFNYVPEFESFKINAFDGVDPQNLISIDKFDNLLELFESRYDLGLLNKVVPYYIWKKVFGSWAQYADIFGMDTRIIRTDTRDDKRRQNAENMLKNMSRAPWAVFDNDDVLELIGSQRTDAYNIYEKLIEKCDQAISKCILGQTGTTDEKTHVGAADVHKGILDDYTESDAIEVAYSVQEIWIPYLIKNGILSDKNLTFKWDDSESQTIEERQKGVGMLLKSGAYIISPEEIDNQLGIEVELKIEDKGENILNEAMGLYLNSIDIKEEYTAKMIEEKYFDNDSFQRKDIEEGIIKVIGKLKSDKREEIQSYRFSDNYFNEKEAKKWLNKNKIKCLKFEINE